MSRNASGVKSLSICFFFLYGCLSPVSTLAQQPGTLTTLAGGGVYGDGGPAVEAYLPAPGTIEVGRDGTVYVASLGRVKAITPDGRISTAAAARDGEVIGDFVLDPDGRVVTRRDGDASLLPGSVMDSKGNLYYWIQGNSSWGVVFKRDPQGNIRQVAGTSDPKCPPCLYEGPALDINLGVNLKLAVGPDDTLYINGWGSVKRLGSDGNLTLVAGEGYNPYDPPSAFQIVASDMAVDAKGTIFYADFGGRIMKVDSTGVVQRVAGNDKGYAGDNGPAGSASFDTISSLTLDRDGNLYVSDGGNYRVRKISAGSDGEVSSEDIVTTFAGRGQFNKTDRTVTGDGGSALGVQFVPRDVAVDAQGNRYIAERHWVRKVDPNGIITTVAGKESVSGSNPTFSGDGGPAILAPLSRPTGVAVDADGNLFIADPGHQRVRKVDPNGTITTVAGNGAAGFSGDWGRATEAALNDPRAVAVDAGGNLYIADTGNFRVRQVTPDGMILTLAGNGVREVLPAAPGTVAPTMGVYSGDGGPAGRAGFAYPMDLALDAVGNLYVVDGEIFYSAPPISTRPYVITTAYAGSARIRRIDTVGRIDTVAGSGERTSYRREFEAILNVSVLSGDGGPAATAGLGTFPDGIVVDGAGNLYISLQGNCGVRKVDTQGIITTLTGWTIGVYISCPDAVDLRAGGMPLGQALLGGPQGLAVDSQGNLLIASPGTGSVQQAWGVADPGWFIAPPRPSLPSSPGDLNRDGKVDIEDAILELQYLVHMLEPTDEQARLGDVDRSGALDVSDAVLILQVAVGRRPDFDDHPPRSDDFASGLAPFWKTFQPAGTAPLPAPLSHAGDGVLALTSADHDIWQTVWEPFLVYQDGIFGDFTMQVKVESVPDCNSLSAAGLMVAKGVPSQVTDSSRVPSWAAVLATRDYGTEAKWGGRGESETSFPGSVNPNLKPPYWLRVDRRGSTLSFFNSSDGTVWSAVAGPVDLAAKGRTLSDPVSAGVVGQTHCGEALGMAVVSHFQAGPIGMAGKLPGD